MQAEIIILVTDSISLWYYGLATDYAIRR